MHTIMRIISSTEIGRSPLALQITIPRYLVEAGRKAHFNVSKLLIEALKDQFDYLDKK